MISPVSDAIRLEHCFSDRLLGNIRAQEASGAKNDRGGLLELLDLVVEGDTLVDNLSGRLFYW